MAKINVLDREISLYTHEDEDYICITDIARYKNSNRTDDLIRNWLRNRNTIEFLGIWEHLNNPGFKPVEFDGFRKQAGLNSFTLTPKQWIEKTNAIGQMRLLTEDTQIKKLEKGRGEERSDEREEE